MILLKKIKFIYNPNAGDKSFRFDIDPCVRAFQDGGYDVHICRSAEPGDFEKHIERMTANSYDALAVCGGDGTVNKTVNAMKTFGVNVPLGIIPTGTANDFARYMQIPGEAHAASMVVARGNIIPIDLGLVGGRYFINVCAAGMFTNISQNIDINFKNTFGKLAYYIKGVEQLPSFMPMKLRITCSGRVFTENLYFFFILNGAGTGGFENLSPGARANDGLFDFIAFRACPIHELAILFVKVLAGEYLDDNRVLFFRDSRITVEPLDSPDDPMLLETDLDGEAGPNLPVEIVNLPGAIELFAP